MVKGIACLEKDLGIDLELGKVLLLQLFQQRRSLLANDTNKQTK